MLVRLPLSREAHDKLRLSIMTKIMGVSTPSINIHETPPAPICIISSWIIRQDPPPLQGLGSERRILQRGSTTHFFYVPFPSPFPSLSPPSSYPSPSPCPFLIQLGGLGSAISSPAGPGAAPPPNTFFGFLVHFKAKVTSFAVQKNTNIYSLTTAVTAERHI